MYIAVRNPAFPASVSTRPICCRLEAAKRASPHKSPPFQRRTSIQRRKEARRPPCMAPKSVAAGKRKSTARVHRMAWNVNGPMESMPARWAIKAEPQITVPNNSSRLPRMFFFIKSPLATLPYPEEIRKRFFLQVAFYTDLRYNTKERSRPFGRFDPNEYFVGEDCYGNDKSDSEAQ